MGVDWEVSPKTVEMGNVILLCKKNDKTSRHRIKEDIFKVSLSGQEEFQTRAVSADSIHIPRDRMACQNGMGHQSHGEKGGCGALQGLFKIYQDRAVAAVGGEKPTH